jgi:hypothetical protein
MQEFLGSYQQTLNERLATGDWPPQLLSAYRLESCLKHVGDKEVYLAVDRYSGIRVVIRVSSLDSGERADAEGRILASLNHPGVPRSFGSFVYGNRSFLIREYFPGRSLDAAVAQETLSRKDIFSITHKLCDILEYLHAQVPPVIHRDIKPQNIILRPDGSLGITDFGIARTFKPEADSDTRYVGTLPYAPPEQYGYAQSTPLTDIYALGIVLVYLATGSPNRQDLSQRIRDRQLLAVIQKCIAFDPEDRFSSVAELRKAVTKDRGRTLKIAGIAAAGTFILVGLAVVAFLVISSIMDSRPKGQDVVDAEAEQKSTIDQTVEDLTDKNIDKTPDASDKADGTESFFYLDVAIHGNLPGNLLNGGFAAESDDELFVYNDGILYLLSMDGTVKDKVLNISEAKSMNSYLGLLWYRNGNTLYVYNPQDKTTENVRGVGDLYFDQTRFYFVNIDNASRLVSLDLADLSNEDSGEIVVEERADLENINIFDGALYYTDPQDGDRLYRHDLVTDERQLIYDGQVTWPSATTSCVYFVDTANGSALMSANTDGTEAKRLALGSYSHLNATLLGVFAINTESGAIELISEDGKTRLTIVDKNCETFCLAGNWVFYKNLDDNGRLWMMDFNGTVDQPFYSGAS